MTIILMMKRLTVSKIALLLLARPLDSVADDVKDNRISAWKKGHSLKFCRKKATEKNKSILLL